jgi:SpoIID/LytB domain protein
MLPRQEPQISVGILTHNKIVFELYGVFHVPGVKESLSGVQTVEIVNEKLVCKSAKNKIESDDEILFEPADPESESFVIRDVVIGLKFHWERKEKLRFNYSLKIIKDSDKIIAINLLPLEKYLASVISSEMSAKCSLEMLKAQAVVARSWILSQMEKSKSIKKTKLNYESEIKLESEIIKWYDREDHKLFDVCADDHCQRYQGITKITSETSRKAVRQTRGIVLTSDGKICDTRYSKCCGGITEAFENVWEPVKHKYMSSLFDYKYEPENFNADFSNEENARKWITGKPSSFCNTNDIKILQQILIDYDRETKDFFRWKVVYKQKEITDIIREKSGFDFGDIIDLQPLERGSSARLIKLKIVGTKKTLTIGKELEIRRMLSKTHLYSSAIVTDKVGKGIPDEFIIYGAGWGHGVGLCQIGAAVMAEKGFMFDEIVLHYFLNAKLTRTYL